MPIPQTLTPALEQEILKRKKQERSMQAEILKMMGPASLGGLFKQAQAPGLGQLMQPQAGPEPGSFRQGGSTGLEQYVEMPGGWQWTAANPQAFPQQAASQPAPTSAQQMQPQPGASVSKQKQAITR